MNVVSTCIALRFCMSRLCDIFSLDKRSTSERSLLSVCFNISLSAMRRLFMSLAAAKPSWATLSS